MNKQGILIGIALTLLLIGIAIATSSASSNVIIYAFDQNPAGSDNGNEWVSFHNPTPIRVNSTGGILTLLLISLRGTPPHPNKFGGIHTGWIYLFFHASFTFILKVNHPPNQSYSPGILIKVY
jgi:hypothetical protein